MSLINKVVKFVKENRIITYALVAVVLSLILFALPGQFAHVGLIQMKPEYTLNGYQYFFNTVKDKRPFIDAAIGTKVSGIGIAGLVIMVVGACVLVPLRKSSFTVMMVGIGYLVTAIFFFAMEKNAESIYPILYEDIAIISWVSYVVGVLMVAAAGLLIYKAVMMMKDEIKHPAATNKGPYYNYLNK